jgi:hypothetical protein
LADSPPGGTGELRRRLGLVAIVAAGLLTCDASSAHAARGIQLGLTDGVFGSADAGTRDPWLDRAVGARANVVLLGAQWSGIAPASRPSGFNPRNPLDPAYNWGTLDDSVRDATARGFRVVLLISNAPSWAEGKHRPGTRKAPPGSWKPSPGALGDFAHAVAARYSGSIPTIPRVRYFQLWAEPNLFLNLTPQWKHGHPFAPKQYRKMLNAFYGGVKSASGGDVVVTGGTAPYGDPGTGGNRMQPVQFWRSVLCLKGRGLRKAPCKHPAHFDVFAHNPINVGRPTRHARNADDASTPDIGRLRRVLKKAERTHRALPKGKKPIWATELWWDSKPPDPHGVPEGRQARFLEQSFYILWKQRVKAAVWFLIRDQAAHGDFAGTYQTGLFLRNGQSKPAYRAFRFPFVGDRKGRRKARIWGEAPGAGTVQIQRKRGGHWRTVKRAHAGGNRVFAGAIHVRGKAKLRAVQGSETSLVWPLG